MYDNKLSDGCQPSGQLEEAMNWLVKTGEFLNQEVSLQLNLSVVPLNYKLNSLLKRAYFLIFVCSKSNPLLFSRP